MSISWNCKSGRIILSDPGYQRSYSEEKGPWSLSIATPAHTGQWKLEATIGEILDWGTRLKSWVTYRDGYKAKCGKVTEFMVAVDSGQMSISDWDSYPTGDETGSYEDEDSFYGQCCALTSKYYAHSLSNDTGVVTTTGIGDGMYQGKMVADKDGKVFRISLNFLRENLPKAADLERED